MTESKGKAKGMDYRDYRNRKRDRRRNGGDGGAAAPDGQWLVRYDLATHDIHASASAAGACGGRQLGEGMGLFTLFVDAVEAHDELLRDALAARLQGLGLLAREVPGRALTLSRTGAAPGEGAE